MMAKEDGNGNQIRSEPTLYQSLDGDNSGATRYYSDSKGRILSEEERAAENVYIQKMERERLEKLKRRAEKEKAEKDSADKTFS
ncbi:hypothetical protein GH714_003721 [Hevea brasiliensis]|uniref:Uncharacterized protein n=1 Tax=Hevea brasiliensis TaxID=3981 RepID=A0A6A6N112_HEVBR|nr:hypothetical protein GH714_003721 [Hevea brasiliensis]